MSLLCASCELKFFTGTVPSTKFPICFRCRENSASIRITNCIEDDQTTYKEEFIKEQTNLKSELMKSLEMQKKNSLAERFARRQETERKQEELEARWRQVQVIIDLKVLTFSHTL